MSTRTERMTTLLQQHYSPEQLHVADDSARHAGHAGAAPGGETHYRLLLVSDSFRGQSRIERSRGVHALLADEFAGGLHALELTLRTPDEQSALVKPG